MNIIYFYTKEIIIKILFLVLLITIITILVISKNKTILIFMLSPIKDTIILDTIYTYTTTVDIGTSFVEINNMKTIAFIPVIEINLPFLTNSYLYYKYVTIISIYILFPIILYIIYVNIVHILTKQESTTLLIIIKYLLISYLLNILITHYIIIKLFIKYIYSHYVEHMYYEFDIEFKIIDYFDLYINIIIVNFLLVFLKTIKKYMNSNIYYISIVLILIALPNDIIIQLFYLFIIIIIMLYENIIKNYNKKIKKYIQKVY